MISESTLAVVTKVAIIAAILFVAVPAAIWWVVRYIEFLSWASNL